MVRRFVLLALLTLFALSCSGDLSSREPKSAESGEEEDILAGEGAKAYGRWLLRGYIIDPIEETKNYVITTLSDNLAMKLVVHCKGLVWITPDWEPILLNYRSSSKSNIAYALRVKWGSGTDKRIDKIWAKCERSSNCQQVLGLHPYKAMDKNELTTAFSDENRLVEVAPSLREPMTTYDKLMLEIEVLQNGSEHLRHYTFDMDGFVEAHDALLAKEGCKPIPPLIAAANASFHLIGDVSWKKAVGQ